MNFFPPQKLQPVSEVWVTAEIMSRWVKIKPQNCSMTCVFNA